MPGCAGKHVANRDRADSGECLRRVDDHVRIEPIERSAATLATTQATATITCLAPPPPPPPSSPQFSFATSSDWGTGFVAGITIKNTGTTALNGWTLSFDFDRNITSIWNAVIVSHVGNHYVIANAAWDATIPPGGTVNFGFQGVTGNVTSGPTNYALM